MVIATTTPKRTTQIMQATSADYEDRSVSSTLTVERSFKSLRVSDLAGMNKKTVRIQLENNQEYEDMQPLYIEDFEDIWYESDDFKIFRTEAAADAKRIAAACQNDDSINCYRRVMERVYDACCDGDLSLITKWDRRELCRLMKDLDRLGLERWSVKSIRVDKNHRKKEAVAIVLEIQDSEHDGRCPYDEMLRMESIMVSRPDALFAHVMAATLARSN